MLERVLVLGSEEKSTRLPGFHRLPVEERIRMVKELSGLTDQEVEMLTRWGSLEAKLADTMIENVIGVMPYPFAVAVNFRVNGRDRIIPMVIEETSVVAAASNAARYMRRGDGIVSRATEQLMIGQIHLRGVDQPYEKRMLIYEKKRELLEAANTVDPVLVRLGGGARDLEVFVHRTDAGPVLTVHLVVDVLDAMGANAVNTMAESLAPLLEELTGGKSVLRIISNLADKRLVRARVRIPVKDIGEMAAEGIETASAIAAADPYRAATHNKGIMNGIIAVALATGQDHRAIEAGAHAYAARSGAYRPLSMWKRDREGFLVGVLEMPLQVGVIGGAVRVHPVARIALKIMGVKTARELAEIMGAVGLAQNFAALKALATEGIQKGHMKLHARNLAIMAGATPEEAERIAEIMKKEGRISYSRAEELLREIRGSD